MRRPTLPLRGALTALVGLGLVVGVAACSSSSSDDSKATTATTKAPEDVLVSNAAVTAGLADLGQITTRAASQVGSSVSAAKSTAHDADEQWESIEGRIKKNDTSAYLEFEDALSDLRTGAAAGEAAKVRKAAASIGATTSDYLAKNPG